MSPAVKARVPSVTGGPETPGSTRQLTAARNTGRQQWQLSTLSQLLTTWLQRKKFQNDYFLLQAGDIGLFSPSGRRHRRHYFLLQASDYMAPKEEISKWLFSPSGGRHRTYSPSKTVFISFQGLDHLRRKPQRLPFLPTTIAFKNPWARWGEKYLLISCLPSAHTDLFAEPLRSIG